MQLNLNQTVPLRLEIFFPSPARDRNCNLVPVLYRTFMTSNKSVTRRKAVQKPPPKTQQQRLRIRLGSLQPCKNLQPEPMVKGLRGYERTPKRFENESGCLKSPPFGKSKYGFYDWHKVFASPISLRVKQRNAFIMKNELKGGGKINSTDIVNEAYKMNKEANELKSWITNRRQVSVNNKRVCNRAWRDSKKFDEHNVRPELRKMNNSFYYQKRVYDQDLEEVLLG